MNNLSSIWRNFLLDAIFTWNHFMYLLTKFKIHLDTITNKANYTRKIQSYTSFTDIPPITHVKNATETTAQIDWKRGARSRTFETWRTFWKLRENWVNLNFFTPKYFKIHLKNIRTHFMIYFGICTVWKFHIFPALSFTWNQFWGFYKCKICHFNTFTGSEFSALLKGWN